MGEPPLQLAVDLGTSTTTAMLRRPDGRIRSLLFDGSPLLPSGVFVDVDGHLHTGRDAVHLARRDPQRMEPNPKRRIDEGTVLLGSTEAAVRDLLAAVFARVAAEARQVAGRIDRVTVTHPAAWGTHRCALLADAAERSGLGRPHLSTEPEAAAAYLTGVSAAAAPPADRVLVYDLGAGTCDVTLLRRGPDGFEVVASDGLNDVGGLDVDAAIVASLERTYGQLWTDPASRWRLWEEVRSAKEMLSRTGSTVIEVPAAGRDAPLGREEFAALVRPVLRPTVAMTAALLRRAGAGAGGTALILVGGASRIPLVATMLHEAVGITPLVTEQPELVVAEGALHPQPTQTPIPAPAVPVTVHPPAEPVVTVGPPAEPATTIFPPAPRTRRTRRAVLTAAAVLALLGAGAAGMTWFVPDSGDGGRQSPAAATSPAPSLTLNPMTRYAEATLPENPCDKVQLGGLAAEFSQQMMAPSGQRNKREDQTTGTCLLRREAIGRPATATITVTLTVHSQHFRADTSYNHQFEDAKRNDPKLRVVEGLGEKAFVASNPPLSSNASYTADYSLGMRDVNLQLSMTVWAYRHRNADMTDAERTKIVEAMIDSARATLARFAA
jgi:actin-like ATPase involved in cell morphogenesis